MVRCTSRRLLLALLRPTLRQVRKQLDPFNECRDGHTFSGDSITVSHKSRYGNVYIYGFRDWSSLVMFEFTCWLKSEVPECIEEMITKARADPNYQHLGYPVFQKLILDSAGEWDHDATDFRERMQRLGVEVVWTSPDDKRAHARGENTMRQIEMSMKAIMLENSLPIEWWEDALRQAIILRNLVPASKNVKSGDGDAIRPLEQLSGGRISRRECDRRLHHLILVGTPCLVATPKVKGSNVGNPARCRWGIALRQIGGALPLFECPFTNVKFRSMSYFAYHLPDGVNFYTFLGLPSPEVPPHCFPQSEVRDDENVVIQLQNVKTLTPDVHLVPAPRATTHGGVDSPMVRVTDQDGRIYSPDETGQLRPTQGVIQVLQQEGVIPRPDEAEDVHLRDVSLLRYTPEVFIGRDTFKLFDGHILYCS